LKDKNGKILNYGNGNGNLIKPNKLIKKDKTLIN